MFGKIRENFLQGTQKGTLLKDVKLRSIYPTEHALKKTVQTAPTLPDRVRLKFSLYCPMVGLVVEDSASCFEDPVDCDRRG